DGSRWMAVPGNSFSARYQRGRISPSSMIVPLRIALKVDCDTAEGTKRGIPRLLRLFEELGIRATFFFSLGPDRSGRAILRVFTRKGFLAKMLRSRAPSLYPMRTLLSGTILPAP